MKTNKTKQELEDLCEELALRLAIMKDDLRVVSKVLNITIREEWRKEDNKLKGGKKA